MIGVVVVAGLAVVDRHCSIHHLRSVLSHCCHSSHRFEVVVAVAVVVRPIHRLGHLLVVAVVAAAVVAVASGADCSNRSFGFSTVAAVDSSLPD